MQNININNWVGLTLEEVKKRTKENDMVLRVLIVDDESFCGTCDWMKNRVNVNVQKGIITETWLG